MTRKSTGTTKGRTSAPRCILPRCRGAARPGHALTATHLAALRASKVETGGPADEKRIIHIASREREDAYYDELSRRDPGEDVAWLIANGPLPEPPTVSYASDVALITLTEASRRLERSPITLRSAIHRGRMVGHKYGRDWLVEESEVRYYELTSLGRVGWPKGRRRKSA